MSDNISKDRPLTSDLVLASVSCWEDCDDDNGERQELNCERCGDTGRIVAMDGYHEYLGYDYLACDCAAGMQHIGNLCPGRKPCEC